MIVNMKVSACFGLPVVRIIMLLILMSTGITKVFAQDTTTVKYGVISNKDFELPDSPYLANADAVYILDRGNTSFEGNKNGWFTLNFKRHLRVKILTQTGFDAASFSLNLYNDGYDQEVVSSLKAIAYNIEGGAIVRQEMGKDQLFIDKRSNHWKQARFTIPGVKVGSIIDLEYTIASDFDSYLRPWNFQRNYPVLWSEYEVFIPEYFYYVFQVQGVRNFDVDESRKFFKTYWINYNRGTTNAVVVNVSGDVLDQRWVMKNVPAIQRQEFVTNEDNYTSKISFQLSQLRVQNQDTIHFTNNWKDLVTKLESSNFFSADIYKPLTWLDKDVNTIVSEASDNLSKAKLLYKYVRDNIVCLDDEDISLTGNGLKDVLKTKKGNVADINMLLVAMLQHEKISAYPVILSKKGHGIATEEYPLMRNYNYVVVLAHIGGKAYYLDASDPMLSFGTLPAYCYNGPARVIMGESYPVYLVADSIKERKTTSLWAKANDAGDYVADISTTLGAIESLDARQSILHNGEEGYKIKYRQQFDNGDVNSIELKNLRETDVPFEVKYVAKLSKPGESDLIYINPVIAEGYNKNPFKSENRLYPLDLPAKMDETYAATFEIPSGYAIDEIPKSTRMKLEDDQASFEYIIDVVDGKIMLRSRVLVNKTRFAPDEYEMLRGFYGEIVKKHSEQIVLRKK